MIKASSKDKDLVIKILVDAFKANKSVNYLVKQDRHKPERLAYLMSYSFDLCFLFGEIFLNDDKTAVALILYPDQKRTTLKTILLDLKLVFHSIGLSNVRKALKRESMIKAAYPSKNRCYLWFIGVETSEQRKGKGSEMLSFILEEAEKQGKPVYLETSTLENIPWYEKHGFHIFKSLNFGYTLHMLRSS